MPVPWRFSTNTCTVLPLINMFHSQYANFLKTSTPLSLQKLFVLKSRSKVIVQSHHNRVEYSPFAKTAGCWHNKAKLFSHVSVTSVPLQQHPLWPLQDLTEGGAFVFSRQALASAENLLEIILVDSSHYQIKGKQLGYITIPSNVFSQSSRLAHL